MLQIGVYPRNNKFTLLACNTFAELYFHQCVEAESSCDGEQDGKNGNNRQ